jgi:hypothetical protein
MEFCFVYDQSVRARRFRRLEDLDNLPPQFQEIALVRRRNNLDERNIENGESIHTNCYRHIIREIEANENDNGDDHCRFNCVLQRRNMCFVCDNNRNLNILSVMSWDRVRKREREQSLATSAQSLLCFY